MRARPIGCGERQDDGQVLPSLGLIVLVASAPSTAWLAVVIGVAESILLRTGLDGPESACSTTCTGLSSPDWWIGRRPKEQPDGSRRRACTCNRSHLGHRA